jgi:CheY-like chemotaxis protein
MPDLNGWEVAAAIRRQDPRIPIVLATGWGTQISPGEAEQRGVTRVLAKPFTVQKVSSLIAELQGSRAAA